MQFVFKPRVMSATLFGECVEERVQSVFRQHHWHLSKVSVGLTPVNGRDGQQEHQCRIDLVSSQLGRFSVTASDVEWPSAFDAALVRASNELRKRMQRAKKVVLARFNAAQPTPQPLSAAGFLRPAFATVSKLAV